MMPVKMLTHNLDLILQNKCFDLIILCLQIEISNEKVDVSFKKRTNPFE